MYTHICFNLMCTHLCTHPNTTKNILGWEGGLHCTTHYSLNCFSTLTTRMDMPSSENCRVLYSEGAQ